MNAALNRVLDAILGALNLFRFWFVIDDDHAGIVLRFGRFHRNVGPGFHWQLPFGVEQLRSLNMRCFAGDAWELTNTTNDGITVTVGYAFAATVRNPRHVLLGINDWNNTVYRMIKIAVSAAIHESSEAEFLSSEFLSLAHRKTEALLRKYGIDLVEFGITERARTTSIRLFNGAR